MLGKHCSGTLLTRAELKKNPRILTRVHLVELSAGGLGLDFPCRFSRLSLGFFQFSCQNIDNIEPCDGPLISC